MADRVRLYFYNNFKINISKSQIPTFLLSLLFVIISVYFAINIKHGFVPDELFHFKLIKQFQEQGTLFVSNTPSNAVLGDIEYFPRFYHLINHLVSQLNIFGINQITFLRLFNTIIGGLSILFLIKNIKIVTSSKLSQVLGYLLMITSPMFIFMSAGINYDNFVILFAIVSLYLSLKFYKDKLPRYFLLNLVILSLGMLSKHTFIVYLIPIFLFNFYIIYSNKINIISSKKVKVYAILKGICILFFALVSLSYLFNIINYRNLLPSCEMTREYDECLEYGIFSRNEELKSTAIEREHDRVTPVKYFFIWEKHIERTLFGVFGDGLIVDNSITLMLFNLMLLPTPVLIIIQEKKINRTLIVFLGLTILFSIFALFIYNYLDHIKFNMYYLAVQGRYLLPSVPFFVLMLMILLNDLNIVIRRRLNLYFISLSILIILINILLIYPNIPTRI